MTLSFPDKMPATRSLGRGKWELLEDWPFTILEVGTTVPKGFVTDLFSIPFPFSILLPCDEMDNRPALIHDWLFATCGLRPLPDGRPILSLHLCNEALKAAMAQCGLSGISRWAIYHGVEAGGWATWNAYLDAGYCVQFPKINEKDKPMKTIIDTIQGCEIAKFEDASGAEVVSFLADADIDCDGTGGNPFNDPCFQPETRLKLKGKSLCAEEVPYAVVPPVVIQKTRGIVMGSKCVLRNIANDKECVAVVGDSGPSRKIGELSPAAAELLGLDPNPNYGGTDRKIIRYQVHVGVPAVIDGITYDLQPS